MKQWQISDHKHNNQMDNIILIAPSNMFLSFNNSINLFQSVGFNYTLQINNQNYKKLNKHYKDIKLQAIGTHYKILHILSMISRTQLKFNTVKSNKRNLQMRNKMLLYKKCCQNL